MNKFLVRNIAQALASTVLLGGVLFAQEAADKTTANAPNDTVYDHFTKGMTPPRPVYQPEAEYADRPRKKKIQGVVIVTIIVNTDGSVRDPQITKSLDKDLDKQALAAVVKWKFDPATKDGKPITYRVPVEINFRLY